MFRRRKFAQSGHPGEKSDMSNLLMPDRPETIKKFGAGRSEFLGKVFVQRY
jgi:hypothetical protein